ncbi:MAG TPA: hypothetical protein VGP72_02860 [Planctomycetota bacterium]
MANRNLVAALRERLLRRGVLVCALVAFACGISLPYLMRTFLPGTGALPFTAVAASVVIDLAGLALVLAWMPVERGESWAALGTWVAVTLCVGPAFIGMGLVGAHQEPMYVFIVLWGLFAAQAALVLAVHALLSQFVGAQAALQVTILLLGAAVTALFWSRPVIQRLASDPSRTVSMAVSRTLTDGVLGLSPPLSLSSVWNQESAAAREANAGQARFDLIRAPMTYDVWLGSYQALPYSQILPGKTHEGTFGLGLILKMLLAALPVIAVCDVLSARAARF